MNDFNKPLDGKKQLQEMMNDEWIVTDNENYIEIASTKTCDSIASVHGGKTVGEQYDLAGRIAKVPQLERELTAARGELETERIRLAACGVVAMADTKESRTKAREMLPEYRSASLSDVERRVDECIELREQRDKLAEALNKMISICSCKTEDIDTVNEIRDFVDTITKHSNP